MSVPNLVMKVSTKVSAEVDLDPDAIKENVRDNELPGYSKQTCNNNNNNNKITDEFIEPEGPAERGKRIVNRIYQRLERTNPAIMFTKDAPPTQNNPKRSQNDTSLQSSSGTSDSLSISSISNSQIKKHSEQ